MTTDKISVEEKKKILPILYLEKMRIQQVYNPILADITKRMGETLNGQILGMGQDIFMMREKRKVFFEYIENELFDDLYEDDVPANAMKDYILLVDNYNTKIDQFIKATFEYFLEFIDKNNMLETKVVKRTEFIEQGEELMTEEEKQKFLDTVSRHILYYKSLDKAGHKKIIADMIYRKLANTKERFILADDKFFEIVGEYILKDLKKEKEKQSQKEEEKPIEVNAKDGG